ncbi:MAG: hypothetical protein H7319_15890 [Spirosoma sp.]|nr:hypothetical protein [Spirosoma sp.]
MNAIRDYDQLRKAVIAMWRFSFGNHPYPPLEHIKMVSGYKPNKGQWEHIRHLLGIVVSNEKPNSAFKEIAKEAYNDFASSKRQDAQWFNDFIADQREKNKVRLKALSKPISEYKKRMALPSARQHHLEKTKELINSWLPEISINWEAVELFVLTFDEWIFQLEIQSNLKMNASDWDDVLNLIYVGPNCLYWTDDHKKTKAFLINAGCENYLYNP